MNWPVEYLRNTHITTEHKFAQDALRQAHKKATILVMTIGSAIRRIRKERGLTLNELAALIESDVGNLSRLERGVQGYTDPVLTKIAGALGVPKAAFFVDDPEQLNQSYGLPTGTLSPVRALDADGTQTVTIPLVALKLRAGITNFQTEQTDDDDSILNLHASWIARNNFSQQNLIAVKVKGDSMETSIYEGDIVVINTADRKPVDGVVFAVNYEGEAVIKRFARDAGEWWLTSDNPDQRRHHRKVCRGDACLIIGRVVHRQGDRI